jgi:hypothetical protein
MNQNKNSHRRSSLRLMLAISLLAVLSVGLLSRNVPTGHGYAADGTCRITGLDTHSTFHYEFTRVLAAAAGFNATDAETIAVANEATDTGSFTGYATNGIATIVAFSNTERLVGDNATLWYHMPRRSHGFPIVTQPNGQAFPGALENTCLYFLKPFPQPVKAPCDKARQGELDQLRAWAINGAALPEGKAPKVIETSKNSRDIPNESGNIIGQNVYALGIYLHAVGDSYSHEKCMMTRQLRAHVPQPFECKGVWHVTSEFGEYLGPQEAAKGAGVPFTLTAARALWQETLKYRQANGLGPPAWDENRFMQFAKDFIATKSAALRVRKAVGEFNQITGATAMPQACPSSRSRKYVVN